MARCGGKQPGAGRPKGSNNLINRELLKVISNKEIKELIKKSYIDAYNGNERLRQYFMDQFVGKAPAQDSKDTDLTVNIFDIMKGKS